jgi:hypothetical protein
MYLSGLSPVTQRWKGNKGMKHLEKRLFAAGLLLLLITICVSANAGDLINGGVTPGSGTPNSIYNFNVIWQDQNDKPPMGHPVIVDGTFGTDLDGNLTYAVLQGTGANDPPLPEIPTRSFITVAPYPDTWEVIRIDVKNQGGAYDDWSGYIKAETPATGVIELNQGLPTQLDAQGNPVPLETSYTVTLGLKRNGAVPGVQGTIRVTPIPGIPNIPVIPGGDAGLSGSLRYLPQRPLTRTLFRRSRAMTL